MLGNPGYKQVQHTQIQGDSSHNQQRYHLSDCFFSIEGGMIVCVAYAHELPKYGMKAALKNYPVTCLTSRLLTLRLLTRFGVDKICEGQVGVTEDGYDMETADSQPDAFTCYLDVGLPELLLEVKVFWGPEGSCG